MKNTGLVCLFGLLAACGSRMELGVELPGNDAGSPNNEIVVPPIPAPAPIAPPTTTAPTEPAPTAAPSVVVPPIPPVPQVDAGTVSIPRCPCETTPPAVDPCTAAKHAPAQVARWGFDEGTGSVTTDSSGHAHTGEIVGATWINDGVIGRALHFDGSSYVRIPRTSDLDIDGAITMIAWIRPSTLDDLQLTIMSKASSATSGYDMGIYTYDVLFGRVGGADGQGRTMRKNGGLAVGQWQQVALTYDGTVGRLYFNGALAQEKTIGGPSGIVPSDLFIGMPADRTSLAFKGDIDEVQIFSATLSSSDIAANYACVASRSCFPLPSIVAPTPAQPIVGPAAPIPAIPVSTSGLVAYYPFSLNGNDSSGIDNHAQVNGPSPTSDRFGNANGAYSFDGVDDSVWLRKPHGFPSGGDPRTVAGWLKSDQPRQYLAALFGFGQPSSGANFQLVIGPSSLTDYPVVFRVNGWGDGSDWRTGVDPAPFLDGTWHHAAVTYDGQVVTMYLDGIARASAMWRYDTSPDYLTIGTEIGGDGTPFKGMIDDVVFFARALSAPEIAVLATH